MNKGSKKRLLEHIFGVFPISCDSVDCGENPLGITFTEFRESAAIS